MTPPVGPSWLSSCAAPRPEHSESRGVVRALLAARLARALGQSVSSCGSLQEQAEFYVGGLTLTFVQRVANAVVDEPAFGNLACRVYVAQVDNDGARHCGFEPVEIEGSKLLPFGDNDDRVRAVGAGIGFVAKCHVGKQAARLFGAY